MNGVRKSPELSRDGRPQDRTFEAAQKASEVSAHRNRRPMLVRPPSKELMARLMDAFSGEDRLIVWVAASTGLRLREQRALTWGEIDFEARLFRIGNRIMDEGRDRPRPTKSAATARTIPVPASLCQALLALRQRPSFTQDEDYVFVAAKGAPLSLRDFVKRKFDPAYRAIVGKSEGQISNWYTLRRYAIAAWIEAGWEPRAVQRMAGISSLESCMAKFGPLFPPEGWKTSIDK